MLYPKVPASTQLAAFAVGFPAGIAVGLVIHALLGRLRAQGAVGAFLARWWAWFAGLVAGMAVAVGIAGPYLFAGSSRSGSMNTSPLTVDEIFGVAGILSLIYASFEPLSRRGGAGD